MSVDARKNANEPRYSEIGELIRFLKLMAPCLDVFHSSGKDQEKFDLASSQLFFLTQEIFDTLSENRLRECFEAQLRDHCWLIDSVLNLSTVTTKREETHRYLVYNILTEWMDHLFHALEAGKHASEQERREALEGILDHDNEVASLGRLWFILLEDKEGIHFETGEQYNLRYDLDDGTLRQEFRGRLDRYWGLLWEDVAYDQKEAHLEWLKERLTVALISNFKQAIDDATPEFLEMTKRAEERAMYRRPGPPPLAGYWKPDARFYTDEMLTQIKRKLLRRTAQSHLGRRLQAIVGTPYWSCDSEYRDKWLDGILAFHHELIAALQEVAEEWPDKRSYTPLGEQIDQAFRRYHLRFVPEAFDDVWMNLSPYVVHPETSDLLPYQAFNRIFSLPGEEKISDQNTYRALLGRVLTALLAFLQDELIGPHNRSFSIGELQSSLRLFVESLIELWLREARQRIEHNLKLEKGWLYTKLEMEYRNFSAQ